MGVPSQIRGLGFLESALLVRNPKRNLGLYSRLPGLKATFSSFESGSRNGSRAIKLKSNGNQSAVLAQNADFEAPWRNSWGLYGNRTLNLGKTLQTLIFTRKTLGPYSRRPGADSHFSGFESASKNGSR